jgi:glucose-6-phosphate 1-dehydrogenase
LNLENVAEGAMAPYTSLIYDVLTGNRSLFTSSAGLEAAFRAFQPLLDHPPAIETYDDDSWGPPAADRLTDELGWHLH